MTSTARTPEPQHSLFMFRPETFAQVVERSVIGVRQQVAKRFALLKEGDLFVAYISRRRILGGHGRITGAPFFDDTPIYPGAHSYPHRVPVEVEPAKLEVDAVDALWAVKALRSSKMFPWGVLLNKGSFAELEPSEYTWLLGQMSGDAG